MSGASEGSLRWAIDVEDTLISTCPEWDFFAHANGGDACLSELVIGKPIWSFLSDPTTRYLYAGLFARVRRGRSLSFPLRCDSPTLWRALLLTMTPGPDFGVAFSTTLVQSGELQARFPLAAPPSSETGADLLVTTCSWCKRILVGDRWVEPQTSLALLETFHWRRPSLTHGICPDCQARMEAEL